MDWDIGCIAKKRALLTPNKTAFIYEDQPITYKELNDNVNRVANYLKEKGIKKGDRISVMLLNCPEFLEIYFAAAKIGAIFVPLNFRLVGPEIEYQLNDSEARLFAFHDMFGEAVNSVRSKVKVEGDKAPAMVRQGIKFLDADFYMEDAIDLTSTAFTAGANAANTTRGVIYMMKSACWYAYTLGHDASRETKGDFAVRGPFRIPEQDVFRYEIVLNMGLHTNQMRANAVVTGCGTP